MDAKSSCDNYGWKNIATICDIVRKAMPNPSYQIMFICRYNVGRGWMVAGITCDQALSLLWT
jgi:hypothetical protein